MPPRYAYWTILAGGLPTAFRAAEREELLPTFNRIKDRHPDAEMKYFARGKLWVSPDAARLDAEARRAIGRRPAEPRGRDWRPGGEHRDPRQTFKDSKKQRNLDWRKERFDRRQPAEGRGRPGDQSEGVAPDRGRPTGAPWAQKPPGGTARTGSPRPQRRPTGPTREGGVKRQVGSAGGPPRKRLPRPAEQPKRQGPARPHTPGGGPARDRRRRS